MSNNRLGELLVREKLISLAQLRSAQEEQQRSGKTLGYTLARLGVISDDDITKFLSHQYRVPTINLDEYEIEPEILKLVSREQCERHRVVPVSRAGSSLVVAMTDPTNLNAIDDLKFLTGYNVEPVIASETAIAQAIERHYNAGPSYDEVMAGFDENEIDFSAEDADLSQMDLERASEDRTPDRARRRHRCDGEDRERGVAHELEAVGGPLGHAGVVAHVVEEL
mgnify:CR=1 FL=1